MLVAAQEAANYADFAVPAWVWLAFLAGFTGLLLVDVLVIHRTAHVVTTRQAAIESAVWIAIGLSFSLVILAWQGTMLIAEWVYIPVGVSLAVIATVLVVSVVISARHDQVPGGDLEPADQHDE